MQKDYLLFKGSSLTQKDCQTVSKVFRQVTEYLKLCLWKLQKYESKNTQIERFVIF